MKKGRNMFTIMIFVLGIGAVLWAVFNNESSENSAVKNYAEGLNYVKQIQTKALTKADFDKGIEIIQASINDIQLTKIPALEASLAGNNTCVEEVFKRLGAVESKQHLFDRKLANTKREISLTLNRPVPVEIVTKAPSITKGKGKATLLEKAGVK